jgi:hypothetical protein
MLKGYNILFFRLISTVILGDADKPSSFFFKVSSLYVFFSPLAVNILYNIILYLYCFKLMFSVIKFFFSQLRSWETELELLLKLSIFSDELEFDFILIFSIFFTKYLRLDYAVQFVLVLHSYLN